MCYTIAFKVQHDRHLISAGLSGPAETDGVDIHLGGVMMWLDSPDRYRPSCRLDHQRVARRPSADLSATFAVAHSTAPTHARMVKANELDPRSCHTMKPEVSITPTRAQQRLLRIEHNTCGVKCGSVSWGSEPPGSTMAILAVDAPCHLKRFNCRKHMRDRTNAPAYLVVYHVGSPPLYAFSTLFFYLHVPL